VQIKIEGDILDNKSVRLILRLEKEKIEDTSQGINFSSAGNSWSKEPEFNVWSRIKE
jgi:hypothetical protein